MAIASSSDLAAIESILGDDAESLLSHESTSIPAERLHLPGPDFVDRVVAASDRPTPVLRSLQTLFDNGRLAGTGYLSILPVDQGIEHSAGASFAANPAYFDGEKIVELAIEEVRPLIDRREQELTVALPPEPVWLYADPTRLEQVLVNLLTNAAKYTDPGGHIRVTVQQEGEEAVLRVRDTGVGIAPEVLPRIFDLFTQAERSLDRSQGGLGIGLALVRRLVEMHQGTVSADSAGPGTGATFTVTLPTSDSNAN